MKSENLLKLQLSVLLVKQDITLNSSYDELAKQLKLQFSSLYTLEDLQVAMYEIRLDNEEYVISPGDYYEGFNL
jgi:hypothetical protein